MHLLRTLCACAALSLPAIADSFIIVSATNPQNQYGTLDNGYTYSGSFAFDTSLIPSTGPFSIPVTTFSFLENNGNGSIGASPADFDSAMLVGTPMVVGGSSDSDDQLLVDGGFFEFDFLEPLGTFSGGTIVYAYFGFPPAATDTHDTAIAVDQIDAPEPAAAGSVGAGLVLLAALLCLRKPA